VILLDRWAFKGREDANNEGYIQLFTDTHNIILTSRLNL